MSTERTSLSLPESLTIGGQTFKVSENPELKDFIGQVSKVEKSKLYTQIEELKQGIEGLRKIEVANPQQQTPATQPAFNMDELKDVVKSIVEEAVQPLRTSLQETKAETLEEFREKLIKENEAVCIPEMVQGSTKEELIASLNESVAVRARFNPTDFNQPGGKEAANVPAEVAQAAQQAQVNSALQHVTIPETPAPATTQAQQAAPAQTAPAVAQTSQPAQVISPVAVPAITDDGGLSTVKDMSPEEFAAHRKSLEGKLKQMVG